MAQPKQILKLRRSTPRRSLGRKPFAPAQPARDGDHSDPFLLAAYHQQIAESEGTITRLRQRVMELNATVSELIGSRAHLSDLFQNAPVGYVIHDQAGTMTEINRTARGMLGLDRAGPVSLVQFLKKDQVPLWLEHLRRADKRLQASTELVLRGKGGKAIPVELITLAFPVPRPPKLFRTVLNNISKRRAAEDALAQSQQDYHRLIDTIEGIVWEADARTFEVTFVSRYAERLLGYDLAERRRPGFWQNSIYVEDRERVANAVVRAVASRQPLRIDYRVVASDRRILWLHDNIASLERQGRLRLLGVAVDATEQHQNQESLRRNHELLEQHVAERTAELRATVQDLESFSYSVSHDLRAPLRAMLGYAEMALEEGNGQLPEVVTDCFQRIMNAAARADRLVQDVLAYSRVSRANFQLVRVDLESFIPQLIAPYAHFQPPKTTVRLQKRLLPVMAHEGLLGQCVSNLLDNAVKFISPGTVPHITIRTERAPDKSMVRLWVQDNGIGIEPQDLGRIFNIFERIHSTEQYSGTGIGLAIVRKAVERMGGAAGVVSEFGKGSRFWLELKAA